jgi:4-hydroxy-tetrahydrodipicolinate synthase
MNQLLTGMHVPLITPFTGDGAMDPGSLESLAHRVLEAGAAGLVALGTTAEAPVLTAAERTTVLDICATACREHAASLIAGAGCNDTAASARDLARLARWPEITAALVVVPYYSRPGEAGVVAHFAELSAASPVPLVMYNIPFRTGQAVSWQAVCELAHRQVIAGVKHSPGAIDNDTIALMAHRPEGFSVLAGDDAHASAMLALGASGTVSASANVFPAEFAALVSGWQSDDATEARALGHRVSVLSAALFAEPNPTVIKGVLHALGIIASPLVRLPLLPASQGSVAAALDLLAGLTGRAPPAAVTRPGQVSPWVDDAPAWRVCYQ